MTVVVAKGLNGSAINAYQPINGELGALQTLTATFWTSSIVYDGIQGEAVRVTFWESSVVFPPTLFDEESAIGQTICVPNPISQGNCATIC